MNTVIKQSKASTKDNIIKSFIKTMKKNKKAIIQEHNDMDTIKELERELRYAYMRFDTYKDEDLVEATAYEIKYLECRIRYLRKMIKKVN